MDIFGYSAHVLVNGRKVKEYSHNGLTFIEAKEGTEFSIEVKNHQSGRVVAIVSVDGIDVVDGKPATSKSRGYILNGHSAETVNGYRRSQDQIATFKFTNSEGSYATDKGSGQNNGIIAVKFVGEAYAYARALNVVQPPRPSPWPKPYFGAGDTLRGGAGYGLLESKGLFAGEKERCSGRGMSAGSQSLGESASYSACASAGMDMAAAQPASFDMGTTWGSVREDKTTEVPFSYGAELGNIEFYYASREALKAMGIPLIQMKALPQAFADSKFAQPPSNWRA
jgi:hypothetical protein